MHNKNKKTTDTDPIGTSYENFDEGEILKSTEDPVATSEEAIEIIAKKTAEKTAVDEKDKKNKRYISNAVLYKGVFHVGDKWSCRYDKEDPKKLFNTAKECAENFNRKG